MRNRAHSGAYIVGVEEAVERLSQRFTLRPGTIVSLGAAGWDGVRDEPVDRASGRSVLEVEVERIGVLRTPVVYPDAADQSRRAGGSPFLFAGTVDEVSPLERLAAAPRERSALAGLPPPRGFWRLFGNQREAEDLELEQYVSPELPMPVAYPVVSLAMLSDTEANVGEPHHIDLPSHSGTIHATCHLAIVIGPEPAYAETATSAPTRIAGYATLLSLHDAGPLESLVPPTTDYESRHTTFLSYCGEGQHVLAPAIGALGMTEMPAGRVATLRVGDREYAGNTAHYLHDAPAAVEHLSRALTLLPGDVIGLGPLGPAVELPAADLTDGELVVAAVDGLQSVRAHVCVARA
ncbi:MAG: hypothetical protein CL878_14500 [Dehalococcoidia bacterium]|nr:hypothetical protein [Dehalococcoidia bacterium]